MNYQKHYDLLIEKANNRSILKTTYKEKHHIIPKCIGGTDDPNNLIELFPEEHLVAHLLLTKIYPDSYKLLQAAYAMTNGFNLGTRSLNKEYGWLKEKRAERQKIWMKENHYLKKMTEEEREEFLDKNARGENNANYGKKWNDEQRKRAYETSKRLKKWEGENNYHYGKRGILSPHYGVPKSKEHIQKMVINVTGEKNPCFGKKGDLAKEASNYTIISPDGNETKLFGTLQTTITEFCLENNLNYRRIRNNINKGIIGQTYKAYKNKIDIVNCEGWEISRS